MLINMALVLAEPNFRERLSVGALAFVGGEERFSAPGSRCFLVMGSKAWEIKTARSATAYAVSPAQGFEFFLRAANFVHCEAAHLREKSSSRTDCPCTAHPTGRIFAGGRATLIHGAGRQIETQNKKQNSPRTPAPSRYPNPCPSLLTLLTSPKMTINLAPSRRSPVLSHNGSASRKSRHSAVFLIANTRLEVRPSHRKLSRLKFPNRERMAILHPISESQRNPASRQLSRRPHRGRSAGHPCRHRPTKPEFPIVTQGLEIQIPLKQLKTIPSKFLVATKRCLSIRPAAWNSPSLCFPNFNRGQRNELRLNFREQTRAV
jgi:hypothetical protein